MKYGYSWYYFDDDGTMAHDTTIGGYYLKDSGEWEPDEDNSNTYENIDSSNSQGTSDADSNSNDNGGAYPDYTEAINKWHAPKKWTRMSEA